MAGNAAKEAETVRDAAVAERETAVHEAKVTRETMQVSLVEMRRPRVSTHGCWVGCDG